MNEDACVLTVRGSQWESEHCGQKRKSNKQRFRTREIWSSSRLFEFRVWAHQCCTNTTCHTVHGARKLPFAQHVQMHLRPYQPMPVLAAERNLHDFFFFLPLIVVGAHMRGWLWHSTMLWCRTAHWTLPIFDSLHFVLRLLNSWCASMRWTWFVSPWFGRPCKQKTRCFTIPFRRRIYLFLFLSLLFFLLYFSFSFFFLGSCSTMLRILEWNAFWSIGFNGCYRLGGGLRIVTQHAIPFPDTHTQSARMSFCSCGAHAPFGRLSIGSWIVIERGQLWPHAYIIIRRHD